MHEIYSSKYLLELPSLFSHRKVCEVCKLVPLSQRVPHRRSRVTACKLRFGNAPTFLETNQVLGYKSAIIGYTESAVEFVVKLPTLKLFLNFFASRQGGYLYQCSLPRISASEVPAQRDANERERGRETKESGGEKKSGC